VRARDRRIREIISRRAITTQRQLAEALSAAGIRVTQATISRDIKRLGLVKVPSGDGLSRYASPDAARPLAGETEARLRRAFSEFVTDVDEGSGLIVVKTTTGSASAVAEVIDEAGWPETVGTVAGDNTILIVPRRPGRRASLFRRLKSFLKG
jgi:transcriptional regulator of arginine metabolism